MAKKKTYESGKIYKLNVDDFKVGKYQPRTKDTTENLYIEELAASIQQSGLLNPVLFHVNDQGEIELVCGERRLLACKKIDLKEIPAMKIEGDPETIALIDNIARENLSGLEEFFAIKKLMEKTKYSQKELSQALGKSESLISRFLSVSKIKENLLKSIEKEEPQCPAWLLFEIAKISDGRKQRYLYNKFKENGLTRETLQKGESKQNTAKQPIYVTKSLSKSLRQLDINTLNSNDIDSFKNNLTTLKQEIDRKLTELENPAN